MEQLVADIEAFAAEFGVTPQKVLRDAVNAEWDRWSRWKAGTASATQLVARSNRITHAAGTLNGLAPREPGQFQTR
jgi:hypothetical protein